MKKLIVALLALCIIIPAYAEKPNKQLEKARKKELSQKLKEYKKGNWEIMGSHTLDFALANHFDKLNKLGEDAHEVEGVSTKTKSKNMGKQAAINNAVVTYAQEAGSTLQGRVVSDLNSNGVDAASEFDNFYATYERLVEKEIRNEMEPSYTIIRNNGDGTYEVRTYFIICESAASKARMRALDEAMKSSEAAQKHAEKISEFVKRGFDE